MCIEVIFTIFLRKFDHTTDDSRGKTWKLKRKSWREKIASFDNIDLYCHLQFAFMIH